MNDLSGAASLFQVFSPAKSPFYAVILVCVTCMTILADAAHPGSASGIIMATIIFSLVASTYFKPSYDDPTYNLSIIAARSAGMIGSVICLTILVNNVDPGVFDSSSRKSVFNGELRFYHFVALISLFTFVAMTFVKAKPCQAECARFNMIQFAVIYSALLVSSAGLFAGSTKQDVPANWIAMGPIEVLTDGLGGLMTAFAQLLAPQIRISQNELAHSLLLLTLLYLAANVTMLRASVQRGWIGEHGRGAHD
jgi:hypothetical protein